MVVSIDFLWVIKEGFIKRSVTGATHYLFRLGSNSSLKPFKVHLNHADAKRI